MATQTSPAPDGPYRWSEPDFLGGHPAIDFTNTVPYWAVDEPGPDRINGIVDLVHWAETAGLLSTGLAKSVLASADRRNRDAALSRVRHFRLSLRRLFLSVAEGRSLDKKALDDLNQMLEQAASSRKLSPDVAGIHWSWRETAFLSPVAPLWPVAQAAADFLTEMDPARLRVCPGNHCGWLFYDRSKSGRRQWCDMRFCGNRAKARRHHARQSGRT